eukprot:TRINITY_DN5125_c0_g1_i1.p1 TRINITY_DN5125_c0_g1~~TRINITY_DN5125_c0_g1_i1.p1  ORF type:complete len:1123 (-),score=204.70 TRINITY_DN5125_c0_g1_i1:147-3515(-)
MYTLTRLSWLGSRSASQAFVHVFRELSHIESILFRCPRQLRARRPTVANLRLSPISRYSSISSSPSPSPSPSPSNTLQRLQTTAKTMTTFHQTQSISNARSANNTIRCFSTLTVFRRGSRTRGAHNRSFLHSRGFSTHSHATIATTATNTSTNTNTNASTNTNTNANANTRTTTITSSDIDGLTADEQDSLRMEALFSRAIHRAEQRTYSTPARASAQIVAHVEAGEVVEAFAIVHAYWQSQYATMDLFDHKELQMDKLSFAKRNTDGDRHDVPLSIPSTVITTLTRQLLVMGGEMRARNCLTHLAECGAVVPIESVEAVVAALCRARKLEAADRFVKRMTGEDADLDLDLNENAETESEYQSLSHIQDIGAQLDAGVDITEIAAATGLVNKPTARKAKGTLSMRQKGLLKAPSNSSYVRGSVRMYETLARAFGEAGHLSRAFGVIERMVRSDIPLETGVFTNLIHACGQAGQSNRAYGVLVLMARHGVAPREETFCALIGACIMKTTSNHNHGSKGSQETVNRQLRRTRQGLDSSPSSSSSSHIHDEHSGDEMKAYARLSNNDDRTHTSHSKSSHGNMQPRLGRALRTLDLMRALGLSPRLATFNAVIGVCGRAGNLERAFETLHAMRGMGLPPDVRTYALLVDACARHGHLSSARDGLRAMHAAGLPPYALVPHTAYLLGLARHAHLPSALRVLHTLRTRAPHFHPDAVLYTGLMHWAGIHGNLSVALALARVLVAERPTAQPTHQAFHSVLFAIRAVPLPTNSQVQTHAAIDTSTSPDTSFDLDLDLDLDSDVDHNPDAVKPIPKELDPLHHLDLQAHPHSSALDLLPILYRLGVPERRIRRCAEILMRRAAQARNVSAVIAPLQVLRDAGLSVDAKSLRPVVRAAIFSNAIHQPLIQSLARHLYTHQPMLLNALWDHLLELYVSLRPELGLLPIPPIDRRADESSRLPHPKDPLREQLIRQYAQDLSAHRVHQSLSAVFGDVVATHFEIREEIDSFSDGDSDSDSDYIHLPPSHYNQPHDKTMHGRKSSSSSHRFAHVEQSRPVQQHGSRRHVLDQQINNMYPGLESQDEDVNNPASDLSAEYDSGDEEFGPSHHERLPPVEIVQAPRDTNSNKRRVR